MCNRKVLPNQNWFFLLSSSPSPQLSFAKCLILWLKLSSYSSSSSSFHSFWFYYYSPSNSSFLFSHLFSPPPSSFLLPFLTGFLQAVPLLSPMFTFIYSYFHFHYLLNQWEPLYFHLCLSSLHFYFTIPIYSSFSSLLFFLKTMFSWFLFLPWRLIFTLFLSLILSVYSFPVLIVASLSLSHCFF